MNLKSALHENHTMYMYVDHHVNTPEKGDGLFFYTLKLLCL